MKNNNNPVTKNVQLKDVNVIGKKKEVTPIIVSDSNDPRLKAYNDSLRLYLNSVRGENANNKYFDFASTKNSPLLSESEIVRITKKINPNEEDWEGRSGRISRGRFKTEMRDGKVVSGKWEKQDNISSIKKDKIKPIGYKPELYTDYDIQGRPEKFNKNNLYDYIAIYKKPVQPIVYQKPHPLQTNEPVKLKTIDQAWVPVENTIVYDVNGKSTYSTSDKMPDLFPEYNELKKAGSSEEVINAILKQKYNLRYYGKTLKPSAETQNLLENKLYKSGKKTIVSNVVSN
jgi:hypothetical protein